MGWGGTRGASRLGTGDRGRGRRGQRQKRRRRREERSRPGALARAPSQPHTGPRIEDCSRGMKTKEKVIGDSPVSAAEIKRVKALDFQRPNKSQAPEGQGRESGAELKAGSPSFLKHLQGRKFALRRQTLVPSAARRGLN